MAINLSNLNMSLDKFNAESSGDYNIGQMKLSSDGKSVYRTNNHKTWTILNRTKISSEEAVAVKFAFCKALASEGLSQEAINSVKQKLGIPSDALDALKAGNIKPLTAAEVREVIDQYADQINQKRASASNGANGVKVLRTSADIYRGVDKKEMEDRAATRNEINANSIEKLMTVADKAVNNLLDLLQFGENGETISKKGKAAANEILFRVSNTAVLDGKSKSYNMTTLPVKLMLQENGKITAKFKLDNGNSFSIDTGLDKEGLIQKAMDVLNVDASAKFRAKSSSVEDKDDDEITRAINEIEGGEIETDEIVGEEIETDESNAEKIKAESAKGVMSNEALLNGLKKVFDVLKEVKGADERKALRDSNLEDVVTALQKALDRARPLDNRNTNLINQVREVFYGNKDIDADHLLKSISDVLNKKRINPRDKIDENILNNIQDDLDENLNINAWLGVDEENEVNAQVEGFGQNAKKIRDAHAKMAERVDKQTGTTTAERRNANMLGIVNSSICDECKKMAAGDWENVTFFNDVTRQLNVTLPNGEKLAGEFEKARDQLSSLVKKDAKYSDLADNEKAKVHVLMAILNQRPSQGLLFSEGLALDTRGNDSKIFFGGQGGVSSIKYAFTLSFAKDGALDIKCRASQDSFNMIMLFGDTLKGEGTVAVMPGKDSRVEATMELKIDKAELGRLAGIDFSKYDADGVKTKYDDPNVQNRYSDRTLLGEDFMLDDGKVTCTSTYKMTVN